MRRVYGNETQGLYVMGLIDEAQLLCVNLRSVGFLAPSLSGLKVLRPPRRLFPSSRFNQPLSSSIPAGIIHPTDEARLLCVDLRSGGYLAP